MWGQPRKPSWRFLLLDNRDRELGLLDGVKGGSIEVAALSRLGGNGQLQIDERGQDIDWLSHRVQVVYNPGIAGVEGWPIATMMFTSPTLRKTATHVSYDVTLLPKMAVIDEDAVTADFTVDTGVNVIDTVVGLLESTGETRIAATGSDRVQVNPQTWEAGTSKLTIINDLLTSVDYWSLWCDGAGQFRVEPYTAPGDRAVSMRFVAGDGAFHRAVWERAQDLSSVPNRFIVVGQGSEDEEPLVGVAELPAESPFSFESRGKWVTRTEEGVEVADQLAADALAARRLNDLLAPVARLTVEHAVVPLVPNDRVHFRPYGLSARDATVQKMTYSLGFNGHVRAEWREL